MTVTLERGGRDLARAAIEALAAWAPRHGTVTSLHAGDVGWHLRLDDTDIHDTIVVVRDGDEAVAVALLEPVTLRPVIRADRQDDLDVAESIGTLAASMAESRAGREVYCDIAPHSALRTWLVERGWELDPDPWAFLYRPLNSGDASVGDGLAEPLASADDVRDRVAVQFNAFDRSTFTVHRWQQMASGPAFRPELDLLRRDADGTPVSAATAWTAGPGRVGILEPVGTHRDHTGQGHGRAVTLAAIGGLARAGASGVAVQTPLSNAGAVRTYQASGLRIIDHLQGLRYSSPDS